MPECIHGFDEGLCDVCFPRIAPPARRAPRTSTRPSRSSSVVGVRSSAGSGAGSRAGSGGTGSRTPSGAPSGPPSFDLRTHRVVHVTHVRNLEAILADGALRADATPVVDVSSPLAREARAELETPVGTRVAQHVPFYLTASATRWREVRSGAEGPHWSAAARAAARADFVVLAVPVSALGSDVIVSDGDAAAATSRFAVGVEAGTQLVRRSRSEAYAAAADDVEAGGGALSDLGLLDAELLAGPRVPIDAIALIGVANDPARDVVRSLLARAGYAAKVAVYPPWFQD